jgi:hypothetical protein
MGNRTVRYDTGKENETWTVRCDMEKRGNKKKQYDNFLVWRKGLQKAIQKP